MPVRIDGTDITGATIDGDDVEEITVDGQTVFTAAPPVIEDFESQSFADYDGATSNYSFETSNVFAGSASLRSDTQDAEIYRNDQLMPPNNTYRVAIRGADAQFTFAYVTNTNNQDFNNSCTIAHFAQGNGFLISGPSGTQDNRNQFTMQTNEYYIYEFEYLPTETNIEVFDTANNSLFGPTNYSYGTTLSGQGFMFRARVTPNFWDQIVGPL